MGAEMIAWRRLGGTLAVVCIVLTAAGRAPEPRPPVGRIPVAAAPTATPEPLPTPAAAPASPAATATPALTATPLPAATAAPTATAVPSGRLELRLWNDLAGTALIQVDGVATTPGPLTVDAGTRNVALLVESAVVSDEPVPVPPDALVPVDLVVPPPLPPLAVVVENSAAARPQSGLGGADVVYEALAEGGITRFLALYLSGDAPVVGPVRSLRHYFAFLAAEYGADLVHVGASPAGFAWRAALGLGALDESDGDPGMWRSRARPAPHNAYTNTATDRAHLSQRGHQQGAQWGPLRFGEKVPLAGQPVRAFALTFAPWSYRVAFEWDASRQRYVRYMLGVPHHDAETGEPLTAASVVVQFAEVSPIRGDPAGRVEISLSEASGALLVFSQGTLQEGVWHKGLPHEPTHWLDGEDGQPLALPPGPVWVLVAPTTAVLSTAE